MITDKVGLLELLSTEDKSTVVSAINEVMATVDWNKITLDENLKEVSDKLDNLKLYAYKELGDNYTMTATDFDKVGFYMIGTLADTVTDDGIKNIPDSNIGDYKVIALNPNRTFQTLLMTSPRYNNVFYVGKFWNGKWQGWTRIANTENLSNPNLLINTDFKDVINQRGQAEYTSGYSIDRWQVFGGALKVNGNQAILAKVGDVNGYLLQRIENGVNLLKNKTVTLSIGIDGAAYSMPVNISDLTTGFDSGNLSFPGGYADIYGNSSWIAVRVFAKEGEITPDWIKLEFGDAATMYVPPNRAEEIVKCQRYYQEIGGTYLIDGGGKTRGKYFSHFYCNQMRVNPTCYYKGILNNTRSIYVADLTNGNKLLDIKSIDVESKNFGNVNRISIGIVPENSEGLAATGIDSNTQMVFEGNARVILDAEVY